jgi:hypothetical protein
MAQPIRARSLTKILARIALVLALPMVITPASCKSGGVQIDGGKGLIGPRRVHVGETFEITQPFDAETGAQWELIDFDSKVVQLAPFGPVDTSDPTSMVRIMRFIAKAPGETDLVFAKRNREPHEPGMLPPPRERTTLSVRVVD